MTVIVCVLMHIPGNKVGHRANVPECRHVGVSLHGIGGDALQLAMYLDMWIRYVGLYAHAHNHIPGCWMLVTIPTLT